MFGAVSGELIRGSKSLGLEALQLHAVGRLMRLGGDVRGQAHGPFLLLLSILLKYARHVIYHFLVTRADVVQLELPVLKTGVVVVVVGELVKRKMTPIKVHLRGMRHMTISAYDPIPRKSKAQLEEIK